MNYFDSTTEELTPLKLVKFVLFLPTWNFPWAINRVLITSKGNDANVARTVAELPKKKLSNICCLIGKLNILTNFFNCSNVAN